MALSIVPPPIAVSIVGRTVGTITSAVPAMLLFAVTCQRHSCHQRHQGSKQPRLLGRNAVCLLLRPGFILHIQGSDPGLSGDLPEGSTANSEEGGTSNPPLTQKLRVLKGLMALQKRSCYKMRVAISRLASMVLKALTAFNPTRHKSFFQIKRASISWSFLSLFRISLMLRFLCAHLAQQGFFLMMQLFNHSFSADEEIFLHML